MATFRDVPESHPFFPAIEALYAAGIANGQQLSDGSRIFRPGDFITRGEMAQMLMNMGAPAALQPYTYPQPSGASREEDEPAKD